MSNERKNYLLINLFNLNPSKYGKIMQKKDIRRFVLYNRRTVENHLSRK